MATVQITEKTQGILQQLASEQGLDMQKVVERAVELYRRQHLLEATNTAYAALVANSAAWKDLEAERAVWNITLPDGLEEV